MAVEFNSLETWRRYQCLVGLRLSNLFLDQLSNLADFVAARVGKMHCNLKPLIF